MLGDVYYLKLYVKLGDMLYLIIFNYFKSFQIIK